MHRRSQTVLGAHILALVTCCLVTSLFAAAARAQSNEYKLDESGNWAKVSPPIENSDDETIARARAELAEDKPSVAFDIVDSWLKLNERTSKPQLAEAYLLRGDALTAMGSEFQGLYDYETVIKKFPATEQYVKANERELDIAIRYCNGYRRKFLGMRILGATEVGEELLIRVQERMPSSRLAERAGIELADYYYRNREMQMAAEAYDLFIKNYPKSPYLMKAMKRRIEAKVAMYKGPAYDGTPLLDAEVLIRRFAALYPSEAQKAGLDDALIARLDSSAAEQKLETADWYLGTGDLVSARYTLRKLIHSHPKTGAAAEAFRILSERGWLDQPVPASPGSEPPQDSITVPASPAPGAPPPPASGGEP